MFCEQVYVLTISLTLIFSFKIIKILVNFNDLINEIIFIYSIEGWPNIRKIFWNKYLNRGRESICDQARRDLNECH